MDGVHPCGVHGNVDNGDGFNDGNELQNQGVHQERDWILDTFDSTFCDDAIGVRFVRNRWED